MNKIPSVNSCAVSKNTMLRMNLRMRLVSKKLNMYEDLEKEFCASYTKEDLEDEKIRTIFATKGMALKHIIKRLRAEVEQLKKAKDLMYVGDRR